MVEPAEALHMVSKQRQQEKDIKDFASDPMCANDAAEMSETVLVKVKVQDRGSLGEEEMVTVAVNPRAPLVEMQRTLCSKLDVDVSRQLLRGFIGNGVQGQPGRFWDLDSTRSAAEYKIDSGECEVHLRCMPAAPPGSSGQEESQYADTDAKSAETPNKASKEERLAAWIKQEAADTAKVEAVAQQTRRQAWLEEQTKETVRQQQEKEAAAAAKAEKQARDAEFFAQQRKTAAATLAAVAAPTAKAVGPNVEHSISVSPPSIARLLSQRGRFQVVF